MQPPTTVSGVKSVCGLLNYFRGYVRQFAKRAQPLFTLTSKKCDWKEGPMPPEGMAAFKDLQQCLLTVPLLAYPAPNGHMHLYTDAAAGSDGVRGGFGAFLTQEDDYGKEHAVGFFSQQLIKHQNNYSAFLLEAAAAKAGMHHFRQLLRAKPFTLHTDHKPLLYLNKVHEKTLATLSEFIADFSFEIKFVEGKNNVVADFLSRYNAFKDVHHLSAASVATVQVPSFAKVDLSPVVLLREQALDQRLNEIIKTIGKGERPNCPRGIQEFALRDGILYAKRVPRKGVLHSGMWVPAVPKKFTLAVITNVHDSVIGGHPGINLARESIMRHLWWPYMGQQITEHIADCTQCQATSNKLDPPAQPPLQPHPATTRPCQRVHVDLFGPLKTPSNKKYVLVMTDAFTKFTALAIIPNKEANTVATAFFDKWIAYLGIPSRIVSDNGSEFVNDIFSSLLNILGIKHSLTAPYHAQANSQAETFNKEIASFLSTLLYGANDTTDQWEGVLANMQLSHNMRVHSTTKLSPLEMFLGFQPLFPLWQIQDMTENMSKAAGTGLKQ
jgi:transposase InsO family protein